MKRYCIKIEVNAFQTKFIFQTERELYDKIVWINGLLLWNIGLGIQGKSIDEEEFLILIGNIEILLNQFDQVVKIIEIK